MVDKLFIFDVGQVSPGLNGMASTKASPSCHIVDARNKQLAARICNHKL
jgi:hypothetical protein